MNNHEEETSLNGAETATMIETDETAEAMEQVETDIATTTFVEPETVPLYVSGESDQTEATLTAETVQTGAEDYSQPKARRSPKQTLLDLDEAELADVVKELGVPEYRARQIWQWLYQQHALDYNDMRNLPSTLRAQLADTMPVSSLSVATEYAANNGQTRKILFRLPDGNEVETVLMLYPDRATVCVSSQAGCALGCTFCATGQMGLQRNLRIGEIVAQVLHFDRMLAKDAPADLTEEQVGEMNDIARKALPNFGHRRVSNIVFMGMGEPFANYANLMAAIRRIHNPNGLGLSARKMTVSTAGLPQMIRRFADEELPVNLAISLHAPTDELRSQLMPINDRFPIAKVMDAAKEYAEITNRRVSFEYILIESVNDTKEVGRQLGRLLKQMPPNLVHVNIIPMNPVAGSGQKGSGLARILAFQEALDEYNIPNTVRVEKGRDIQAACGQLKANAEQNGDKKRLPMAETVVPADTTEDTDVHTDDDRAADELLRDISKAQTARARRLGLNADGEATPAPRSASYPAPRPGIRARTTTTRADAPTRGGYGSRPAASGGRTGGSRYNEDRPARPFNRDGEDRPRRSFDSDSRPPRPFNRDDARPARPFNRDGEDRPRRSFDNDSRPARPYSRDGEDRPRRSFDSDSRPARPFNRDGDDRPRRSFDNDSRPARPFNRDGDDRPRRSVGRDDARPARPFNRDDARPARPFSRDGDDRPRRSFDNDSRPARPFNRDDDRPARGGFGRSERDDNDERRPKRLTRQFMGVEGRREDDGGDRPIRHTSRHTIHPYNAPGTGAPRPRPFNRDGEDRPRRSFDSDSRPARPFNRDGDDRPRRSVGRDEERPRRFERDNDERPRRSFERDGDSRPTRGGFERDNDRPARPFNRDGDSDRRPARSFERDNDRPARSFERDRDSDRRPARPFNRDADNDRKPARSFERDSRGGGGSRPTRAPGGGGGRSGGGSKPSYGGGRPGGNRPNSGGGKPNGGRGGAPRGRSGR